jgi:energy-coupling factor transporter ATP-binding protein EcfA2
MTTAGKSSADDVFTEAKAFADLLVWSKDRPKWQQDALRRLVLTEALSDEDITELAAICMDPKASCDPISSVHLAAETASGDPVSLVRIENPTGINALAADQKLEFCDQGLTVIYGDNGSGKSGFVRVLKHACRTRDRGTKILRDVEDTAATPQTAQITFNRGKTSVAFPWTPEVKASPDLAGISIFDSRSAHIHVEKTNAVAYIPQPMKVLEALASACDQVRSKLDAQVKALEGQTPVAIKTPQLSSNTAAGAFLHNISAKSNLAQLNILVTLTPAEQQRFLTLEADLGQDPKRAATRILNQKQRLEEYTEKLRALVAMSSDESFAKRNSLKEDHQTKVQAAKLASDALFAASPLPAVGQAVWVALWEAARKYSDEVAYPDKAFPDAEANEDVCVLCQQPLGLEAIQRRTMFESFVKGTTRADEAAAKRDYDAILAAAVSARMTTSSIRQLHGLIASEIGDAALADTVRACAVRVLWRLRAFIREQQAPGAAATYPAEALALVVKGLASRAAQLSADQQSPEYLALVKEFKELKDRLALLALLADVKAEIDRLKSIEFLKKAIKDTAKNAITTKNRDFSDKLVTDALRGRFAREITKMNLSRMPVELKKMKDQSAVSYFQVCLVEKPNEPVGEIFSEGEHRCVALAAFLAELVTSKRYSGIVFDDPMSSLDHIHRKAVAARLVEEAEHRQVVIFTHDLPFLYEVRREAEAKSRPIHYQTVKRKLAVPGYVEGELPNKAKSALHLAQSLRSELKAIKGQFDHWNDTARTIFCKGFIEQLREAWDQGIADFIFPVLGRFDNHIKGTSLFKLVVLSEDDVKTVTAARGRLSEELHVTAETLNPETVQHAALVAEIGKLAGCGKTENFVVRASI